MEMEHALPALYEGIQRLSPIPIEEWNVFRQFAFPKTVAKNAHLVREGEQVDSIAICMSGLFRLYYTTPDGGEFNKSFCAKHEFLASYSSLLLGTSSFFSIQALVDSELIVVRYSDFQSLFTRHVCWERLGRILTEQLFVKKETRERELLLLSAEERYRLFNAKYGHLAEQIPQYHIASYLGITPVALSRIRRKLT
ncbi:Crp/Fnr family transcriptional regulator [Cohnella mopanensis]|uniref:Crp/Fnr family transcriptional regulator n=1 Tax=Cohnella mopanensis TaxID=2911966 RepID=UPI001EF7D558|nr:Crp/Fnr family transcriptional regulator [Cohnella mopanensis]